MKIPQNGDVTVKPRRRADIRTLPALHRDRIVGHIRKSRPHFTWFSATTGAFPPALARVATYTQAYAGSFGRVRPSGRRRIAAAARIGMLLGDTNVATNGHATPYVRSRARVHLRQRADGMPSYGMDEHRA